MADNLGTLMSVDSMMRKCLQCVLLTVLVALSELCSLVLTCELASPSRVQHCLLLQGHSPQSYSVPPVIQHPSTHFLVCSGGCAQCSSSQGWRPAVILCAQPGGECCGHPSSHSGRHSTSPEAAEGQTHGSQCCAGDCHQVCDLS